MSLKTDSHIQAAPPGLESRVWVEIDPAALRRNAERLAARLGPGGRLIACAKKDGYGHGLATVAGALDGMPSLALIGVATLEEAMALRAGGYRGGVLCFTVLHGEALDRAVAADVTLSVTDPDEIAAAAAAGRAAGRIATLHLKLDTGMGRLGRLPAELLPRMERADGRPVAVPEGARLEALGTHLADGWDTPASARRQLEVLLDFRRRARLEGIPFHLGGSDAVVLEPALTGGAWVRAGISLYGDHPGVDGLEPAMNFKSRVIYRRAVPAGTTISYGMTFTTARPSELALVGAGYGNGYLRGLSGRGTELLARGRRLPLAGRICMDQAIVDVTDHPEVSVGDEAVLFGRQGEALLPAREVADRAGTISYELFCLAGQINPRKIVDHGTG